MLPAQSANRPAESVFMTSMNINTAAGVGLNDLDSKINQTRHEAQSIALTAFW